MIFALRWPAIDFVPNPFPLIVTQHSVFPLFRAKITAVPMNVAFFTECASGSRFFSRLFVDDGAAMSVDSAPQKSENARLPIVSVTVSSSFRSYRFCNKYSRSINSKS